MDEADAFNQLLDADLTPGTRTDAFDADVPAGTVISTDPTATTEVDRGSTVDYVVSLGYRTNPRADTGAPRLPSRLRSQRRRPTPEPTPATVFVPDVRGFQEADAINTLLDAGPAAGRPQRGL